MWFKANTRDNLSLLSAQEMIRILDPSKSIVSQFLSSLGENLKLRIALIPIGNRQVGQRRSTAIKRQVFSEKHKG